jgi:preprotein translocase subunit YajC
MQDPQGGSILMTFLPIVLFVVVMYFLIFLPQKKRDKKTKEMLDSMQVGHQVITIGGITGKIVNIKDDEVTIETGVERAKINFKKWAIKEVIKPVEA